jgi:hypothetical protein
VKIIPDHRLGTAFSWAVTVSSLIMFRFEWIDAVRLDAEPVASANAT